MPSDFYWLRPTRVHVAPAFIGLLLRIQQWPVSDYDDYDDGRLNIPNFWVNSFTVYRESRSGSRFLIYSSWKEIESRFEKMISVLFLLFFFIFLRRFGRRQGRRRSRRFGRLEKKIVWKKIESKYVARRESCRYIGAAFLMSLTAGSQRWGPPHETMSKEDRMNERKQEGRNKGFLDFFDFSPSPTNRVSKF